MIEKLHPDSVEPKYYPNTTVFLNLSHIQDLKRLRTLESDISLLRSLELLQKPDILTKTFDFSHLRLIHHFLFQDIYSWAGMPRSFDMHKNGDIFTPAKHLLHYEQEVFQETLQFASLKKQPNLVDTVKSLSISIRKINAYHPFPEGNGRTQRVFISTLAKEHGYHVDWKLTFVWEMSEVFHQAHNGNHEPLECVLKRIVK